MNKWINIFWLNKFRAQQAHLGSTVSFYSCRKEKPNKYIHSHCRFLAYGRLSLHEQEWHHFKHWACYLIPIRAGRLVQLAPHKSSHCGVGMNLGLSPRTCPLHLLGWRDSLGTWPESISHTCSASADPDFPVMSQNLHSWQPGGEGPAS